MSENTLPEIGTFLVSSWGYDETNVTFYKVVGHTPSGKSVRLQKWENAWVSGGPTGSPVDYVVPGNRPAAVRDWENPEYLQKDAPIFTKRWSPKWGGYISMSTYAVAKKWDGKPAYQTGPGWGH